LEAARFRRRKLNLTPAEYLPVLRRESGEWDELWDMVDSDQGDSFFRFPGQFELLGQLLAEKAVTAVDRKLRVLSACCGPGYEPYSLAIALTDTRLAAKGWDISIKAFDLSDKLVARAKAANFTRDDLEWLDQGAARRWFTLRAAGWHFKTEQAPPVEFFKFNLAESADEPKAGQTEAYDVIFCRGRTFDCPDHQVQRLTREVTAMLAPEGLLFTAPGEVWPEVADLGLEERAGVVYGRKAGSKGRSTYNIFHVTKKRARQAGRGQSGATGVNGEMRGTRETAPQTDPRLAILLSRFHEFLHTDPDEARELVLEILEAEMGYSIFQPQTLALMAEVEYALGREECAASLKAFLENVQKG
jgi:chemotaxis methyl-accepting protein methylase